MAGARRAAYELRLVLTAIQFFTRIPVPAWTGYSAGQLNDSARHFPLVGVLVGAVTGAVFVMAVQVWPQHVAVILAMLTGVLLTGGFHEDGLADACDGFGGGQSKERVLEIMKDSRVGSFGVLGLAFALLLKFACLSALPATQFLWIAIAAHGFSRFMAVSVMAGMAYVRDEGSAKSKPMAKGISIPSLCWAGIVGLAPLSMIGASALLAAALAIAVRLLAASYFQRRIGGYTGDCLGATQQVCELAFYLGWLAWMSI